MSIKLLPCPFCGDDEPEFERMGTGRVSCIVICTNCGCRHDSGDSGEHNGTSWNRRPKEEMLTRVIASYEEHEKPNSVEDEEHTLWVNELSAMKEVLATTRGLLKEARNGLTAAWFGSSLLQRIKNALGE